MIADALSRISIDELKGQYDDNVPIYAITSSMTEKAKQKENSKNVQQAIDIDCSDVKEFEDFNTGITNKIPRLRTNVVSIKRNGTVSNLTICAYQSHRKLFEIISQQAKKLAYRNFFRNCSSQLAIQMSSECKF